MHAQAQNTYTTAARQHIRHKFHVSLSMEARCDNMNNMYNKKFGSFVMRQHNADAAAAATAVDDEY